MTNHRFLPALGAACLLLLVTIPAASPARAQTTTAAAAASAPATAAVPAVTAAASQAAAPPDAAAAGVPAVTSAAANDQLIQLNLPPVVELKVLIDYVCKRLNMNIIYDEAIGQTRVAVVSPAKIRESDLLKLLQNALKMAGLELTDTAHSDWKVIGRKATVKFVTAKNLSASDLAKRVSTVLDERDRISGGAGRLTPRISGPRAAVASAGGAEVALVSDAKSNQIAVIATTNEMPALALIGQMDIPLDLDTKTYRLHNINPQRIDNLMRNKSGSESNYSSIVDEPSGLLLVTAGTSAQKQVATLVRELDVESDPQRSNIQFYKLMNTTATDVLQTIRSLQGGPAPQGPGRAQEITGFVGQSSPVSPTSGMPSGPNLPSSPGLITTPPPPSFHPSASTSKPSEGGSIAVNGPSAISQNAVVSVDLNTNTVIVVAPPDVQRMYKQLIHTLDKRRPQVLIEVMLVTLDENASLNLGVELSKAQLNAVNKVVTFSSFGLSEIDPLTGIPVITPAAGFNGTLISPSNLNVVVQALATQGNSKILAAPKVLVNDNANGMLASISEAPFTSVNASDTVSTTSFAGYAQAGTTVNVTPHISQGDYLQLKYSVALNSFTSQPTSGTVPPPRQTDTVSSEVTVPNGYAVVVGGLTRKDVSRTVSKVPILGDIPIVKYLFSSWKDTESKTRLYVFIRPVILRDDKFEDLKYLSDRDLSAAKLPANYPPSEPLIMQ